MFDSPRLTHNAVLYLSLGFTQQYLMQVLTLSRNSQELHLVLYDGLAYIGALFTPSNTRPLPPPNSHQISSGVQVWESVRELDVVKVVPMFARPNEPVVIQSMEIVQSGLAQLLGQEAITLSELMRRREFRRRPAMVEEREEGELSPHSRKIAKLLEEGSFEKPSQAANQEKQAKSEQIGLKCSDGLREGEVIVLDDFSAEQQEVQEVAVPEQDDKMVIEQKKAQVQPFKEKLDKEERQSSTNSSVQIITKCNQAKPQSIIHLNQSNIIDTDCQITSSLRAKTQNESTQRISDLYQRMHRFRLLCRVNHISCFTSQRGTFCTKLHLIDEVGDQIICMIFQKAPPNDPAHRKVIKGRAYVFQEGEVTRQEDGTLGLSVPVTGIIDYNKFMPSFAPSKMLRLGDIGRQESSDYYMERAINLEKPVLSKKQRAVTICGIFEGLKEQPRPIKNNFKVIGILCDPDHQLSVHFYLIVDELSSFPCDGSVVSLHNIHVVHDDRTIQLEGGKNSYILNQIGNTHEYFSDLLKSSQTGQWRMHDYKNLSLITYTPRTIAQLKKLLNSGTQDNLAYSQIDCRISGIKQRRSYEACMVCKRQVKADSSIFTTCFSCKKLNKHATRFLFDMELSDATGCLIADLSSDNLVEFIGMGVSDYAAYNREQRAMYMDLCAYKEIVVRLKSERVVGGLTHRAISAGKPNHKRSLSQIRAMTIEEKTKYVSPW